MIWFDRYVVPACYLVLIGGGVILAIFHDHFAWWVVWLGLSGLAGTILERSRSA